MLPGSKNIENISRFISQQSIKSDISPDVISHSNYDDNIDDLFSDNLNAQIKYTDQTNNGALDAHSVHVERNVNMQSLEDNPLGLDTNNSKGIESTYLANLDSDLQSLNSSLYETIHFCIYRVKPNTVNSFIQYLLYKYTKEEVGQNGSSLEGLMVFPFLKNNQDPQIESLISRESSKIKEGLKYKGYVLFNKRLYVFYHDQSQIEEDNIINLTRDSNWVWGMLTEIINYHSILNYPIHESVYSLFLANANLINNGEIPIVCYYGETNERIEYTTTFANNINLTLTTYKGAVLQSTKKMLQLEKSNKSHEGSVVRFAVFVGKLIIGTHNNISDDDHHCMYRNKFSNKLGEPTWKCSNSKQYSVISYS